MLPTPDALSVTVRAIGWICLFQALGGTLFVLLFRSCLDATAVTIERWIARFAIAGVLVITLHLSLEATRMTGDYGGFMDASMQGTAWRSSTALSHLMQVIGLLIIVLMEDRFPLFRSIISSSCVVLGFVITGHTSEHPWKVLLMPLLGIHVLVAAFWFGSLLPLWLVVQRESAEVAQNVLRRFSAMAVGVVPFIAIIGVIMVVVLANGLPSLNLPYWKLILTKGSGFIVLMAIAALNKWMWGPAANKSSHSRKSLQLSILMEMLLIIAILAVTAVMTTFYSPDSPT